jgi:hypothetical protein
LAANYTVRYAFAPISDDGAFLFVTDSGCYYTIQLSNKHQKFNDHELLFNDGEAFELSIDRKCDDVGKSPFDDAVSNTILHILTTNIEAKGDTSTFFYVCDTTDGDGSLRARKFNMWYLAIKKELPLLEKYNFILPGFDGEKFDISLLIFSNHPKKEEYIEEFYKKLNSDFGKE